MALGEYLMGSSRTARAAGGDCGRGRDLSLLREGVEIRLRVDQYSAADPQKAVLEPSFAAVPIEPPPAVLGCRVGDASRLRRGRVIDWNGSHALLRMRRLTMPPLPSIPRAVILSTSMSYERLVSKISPRGLKRVARKLGYSIYVDPMSDVLRCRRLPLVDAAGDVAARDSVMDEILRVLQAVERLGVWRKTRTRIRLHPVAARTALIGRGRGRPRAITDQESRMAMLRLANGARDREVAADLGVSRATLYRALHRVRGNTQEPIC